VTAQNALRKYSTHRRNRKEAHDGRIEVRRRRQSEGRALLLKGEVQTNMSDPDEEVINFGVADKLLEENKKGARNG
jgi:hypothetical protein